MSEKAPFPSSSPLSSAPASQRTEGGGGSTAISGCEEGISGRWRTRRELPFEIQQFVRIYFEESLFTKALDFLLAIVTSDVSSFSSSLSPSPRRERGVVTVPPTEHLALIATLAVHPWLTTRTTSEEKRAEAVASLRLLRLLLKTGGPVTCGFKEAFRFRKLYDAKAVTEAAAHSDDNNDNSNGGAEENGNDQTIRHPFANEDGIWHRADDFWAVVGWAMNCSCLSDKHYAGRWEQWQLWLDFMTDVLEQDWLYHRSRQSLDQSILWTYTVQSPSGNNNHARRILRAVFADGSKTSLNEFREIFRRELKGPKQDSDHVNKREAVDIDNEIYGDYLKPDDSDDDSEAEIQTSNQTSTRSLSTRRNTPRTQRQSPTFDPDEDSSTTSTKCGHGLGPPEAIALRLRLIQLLIYVASEPQGARHSNQTARFPDLTDLYTLFVEFIKSLSLPAFQQITCSPFHSTTANAPHSNTSTISMQAHTSLLMFLLQRLLETTSSSFLTDSTAPLTQHRLEVDYLPHAANKSTADANARVSICIEGLIRNLKSAQLLKNSNHLQTAIEQGIERRKTKVVDRKRDRGGKDEEDEESAMHWLTESSMRIKSAVRRLRT